MNRTIPIDLLRGFIMMLMAIDHASGMIARTHFMEVWGYEFAGYGGWEWWLTRFVSHLCAPGFFLLMGMSVYLFAKKRQTQDWTPSQIRRYFFKRGALILGFMVFLEFPAWGLSNLFQGAAVNSTGSPLFPGQYDGGFILPTTVLYGLAMCMMVSAWLWKYNKFILLSITALCFGFSTWYIGQLSPEASFNPLAVLAFTPGLSNGAMVIYPIIPWLGITTFGIFLAQLLEQYPKRFYRLSLQIGLSFLAIFLLLRGLEWGNFQLNAYDDLVSFFTLVKYPPSIVFALLTCGINLVLLFVFSKIATSKYLQPVRLFGQTAMFFYISHLYVYALFSAAFPQGSSIGMMYALWAVGLVGLYFLCRWFLNFKRGKPANSLWRLV